MTTVAACAYGQRAHEGEKPRGDELAGREKERDIYEKRAHGAVEILSVTPILPSLSLYLSSLNNSLSSLSLPFHARANA